MIDEVRKAKNDRPDTKAEFVGGFQIEDVGDPPLPERLLVRIIPRLFGDKESLQIFSIVILPKDRLKQVHRQVEHLDIEIRRKTIGFQIFPGQRGDARTALGKEKGICHLR